MERARIVIYLEKSDELRMTAKAKENGELLAEWARNVLRNELTINRVAELADAPPLKEPSTKRASRRAEALGQHAERSIEGSSPSPVTKHTADSNWRTCGCETCVQKRKAVA